MQSKDYEMENASHGWQTSRPKVRKTRKKQMIGQQGPVPGFRGMEFLSLPKLWIERRPRIMSKVLHLEILLQFLIPLLPLLSKLS